MENVDVYSAVKSLIGRVVFTLRVGCLGRGLINQVSWTHLRCEEGSAGKSTLPQVDKVSLVRAKGYLVLTAISRPPHAQLDEDVHWSAGSSQHHNQHCGRKAY